MRYTSINTWLLRPRQIPTKFVLALTGISRIHSYRAFATNPQILNNLCDYVLVNAVQSINTGLLKPRQTPTIFEISIDWNQ